MEPPSTTSPLALFLDRVGAPLLLVLWRELNGRKRNCWSHNESHHQHDYNDSTQTSFFCLTIVRAFKCVCAEMLGTSSLSCVAHWPRFQLFSARDNGRNGFITEHNTWVLFSTIVFKGSRHGVIWCCALCALCFTEPVHTAGREWQAYSAPLTNFFKLLLQMVHSFPPTHLVQPRVKKILKTN